MRESLVFVINSLGLGGAERALGNVIAHARGRRSQYDIHLVLLDTLPKWREVPAFVTLHELDGRRSLLRSVRQLAALLHRLSPSLIISFLVRANVAGAIAGRLLGIPVVVCERMHLSSHLAGRYRPGGLGLASLAPRLAYRGAARVVGVSTGVTDDLVMNFGVPRRKSATIFNPYDLTAIRSNGSREPEIRLPDDFVVAVGRLESSKNFPVLIDAFLDADIAPSLVILGEGSKRPALEAHVTARRAEGRVLLPGHLANPFAVVGRAAFFAASSLNEGFPNAMVEAMALGRAVVATDCPSGPAEILAGEPHLSVNGPYEAEFGVLAPMHSVEALANALRLMADPARRRHYAEQAARRAEEYEAHRVSEQYWSLFESVLCEGGV